MSFGLPFVGGVVWLWPWSWPTDGLTFVCFPSLFRRYTDYCESSQGLRRRDHARHRPLLGPLIRYLTARYSASGLLRCLPRRVEHLQKKKKEKKRPKRKSQNASRTTQAALAFLLLRRHARLPSTGAAHKQTAAQHSSRPSHNTQAAAQHSSCAQH
jgi:hypothetical protein